MDSWATPAENLFWGPRLEAILDAGTLQRPIGGLWGEWRIIIQFLATDFVLICKQILIIQLLEVPFFLEQDMHKFENPPQCCSKKKAPLSMVQ
jgi:hypothetical protein